MKYYSQHGQDRFLYETFFKDTKNGVFVEVGAYDGIFLSNTYFFETELAWTGMCIEPIPSIYDKLVVNRPNCINVRCAIDSTEGNSMFILNTGYPELLSGLARYYDPRHFARAQYDCHEKGGAMHAVSVPTRRLDSLFTTYGYTRIHYISIDVEGGELGVLESIDYDKVYIDILQIENNFPEPTKVCEEFIRTKGYERIPYSRTEDVLFIHKDSEYKKYIPLLLQSTNTTG